MATDNKTETAPKPSHLAATWAFLRQLGPVGPVAIVSMTLPGVMGIVALWQANAHRAAIYDLVQNNFSLAIVLYIASFAVLAGLPIMPTYAISLIGGYFLGVYAGFAASLAGYAGAAIVSYLFLYLLSGDRVERVIAEHPKWKIVRDELLIRSHWRTIGIIALLRLPPNLPFAVINLVLVTAKTNFGVYITGSVLGVIPRTAAVVLIASAIKDLEATDIPGKWWWTVVGIALTVVVLGVITRIAQKALHKIAGRDISKM